MCTRIYRVLRGRWNMPLTTRAGLSCPRAFASGSGPGSSSRSPSPIPCLALYPSATWATFCDRLEAAPRKDERYRRFVRHLFAHTEEVACDAQGRLVIPAALRAYAGIERDVVSVGSLTRVEVWAKERYAAHAAPEGEVADFMADLGLY